jgi:spermidine synthase
LGLQFGTTAPAIATVLAAFMAGLALGNVLIGPRADRHPSPLRLYGAIELGIGVTGLGVSLLLLRGDVLLAHGATALAGAGEFRTPLRFLLFGGLMLLPATLMGGTLPVMARALVRSGVPGRVLGRLYAVNTAGAVAGALAPDLLLIPAFGLTATAFVAAAGNLVVAALVTRVPAPPPPPPTAPGPRAGVPRGPVLLYAISGFCAMGYEVLWSRVHHHFSMGQTASFAVLLAVFLVFLSIGSILATPLADRSPRPLATAAMLLALTGPAAFLPILAAPAWAERFNRLLPSIRGVHRVEPLDALALALGSAVWLEALACLSMGATFPFLAAAAVREGDAGRATGRLYAANTAAGAFGAGATGFVLLPALGVQLSLLLLAAVATLGGALALGLQRPIRRPQGLAAAAAAVAIGTMAAGVPIDHLRGAYFSSFHGADSRLVELREGSTTTAAVARRHRFGEPAYLLLLTPGVTMSDTQIGAQRYMGLMAHLPMAMSRDAREALLICYGVGNTARSLLTHPTLERLDVVDIAAEVLALSGRFAEVHGGDPLADERVEIFVEDGRQHLLTSGRRYDVVTSEPPPPTDAGVVNLYTREYYQAVRGALKPGGVLAQWLPLFQLTAEETTAIIAAFVAEFDHVALHYGYAYQWILLGSDEPLELDLERLESPSPRADLQRYGAHPVGLAAERLQDDAGLRAAFGDAVPLTDDRPSLQYPSRGLAGAAEVPDGLVGPVDPSFAPVMEALSSLYVRDKEQRSERITAALAPLLTVDPADEHLLSLLAMGRDWYEPALRHIERGGTNPRALNVVERRQRVLDAANKEEIP